MPYHRRWCEPAAWWGDTFGIHHNGRGTPRPYGGLTGEGERKNRGECYSPLQHGLFRKILNLFDDYLVTLLMSIDGYYVNALVHYIYMIEGSYLYLEGTVNLH